MTSHPAYALVPIIGGLSLILGTSIALYVDRLDLLSDGDSEVQIRYISQATYDLKKRPHWIFLAATVIFAPCLMVTAIWQSEILLLASSPDDEEDDFARTADSLRTFGLLAGAMAVGVSSIPMGTSLGTILHVAFAAGLGSFGINYSVRAEEMANLLDKNGLATFRFAMWIVGLVGAAITMPSVIRAATATEKLQKHKDAELELTASQIRRERLWETFLAVGQITMGSSIAIVMVSAAAEVPQVQNGQAALVVGLVSTAASLSVFALCYFFNDQIFSICQKKNSEEKDKDEAEDEDSEVQMLEGTSQP